MNAKDYVRNQTNLDDDDCNDSTNGHDDYDVDYDNVVKSIDAQNFCDDTLVVMIL